MLKKLSIILILFNIAPYKLQKIISLDEDWEINNHGKSIQMYGKMPGTIYHTLFKQKIIPDPLYGFNDILYRNMSKDIWIFNITKKLSTQGLNHKFIVLHFDGIDTIASVYVNDIWVGNATNMFVPQNYKISAAIGKSYENVVENNGYQDIDIKLIFESPINFALNESLYTYADRPIPPQCPVPIQNGECHINLLRKEQCSFSWDWGPAIPDIGIWKSSYILMYDNVYMEEINVFTDIADTGDVWNVVVKINFNEHFIMTDLDIGHLSVQIPSLLIDLSEACKLVNGSPECEIRFDINSSLVDLWWPAGHGNQTLYDMMVTYKPFPTTGPNPDVWQKKSLQVGFRTVKLVQDDLHAGSGKGRTFYFEVNGRPIYAKGSNWIPADLIKPSITDDYIDLLLNSVKEANMNMLRVWGGGTYESDHFYQTADRLGIMIWQDAMFACALYPANPNYLESVTREISYQVKRLQHHPSVVVWSANNENELALVSGWYSTDNYSVDLFYADYHKLYVDTVYKVTRTILGPKFPILLSSPSNGNVEIESNKSLNENPQNPLYGDVHFYDYSSDPWNWTIYPRARFVSEYGYQSWPAFDSVVKVVADKDKDLSLVSKFANHRQHHSLGNFEMLSQISLHFTMPNQTNTPEYFRKFLYLSQVNQAVAIKTQTEFYRRNRPLDENGRGYNMGALYWQLNDVWIAPTWSSIEYGGTWKMLHYAALHFFKTDLIVLHLDGTRLSVNLVSDVPSQDKSTMGDDESPQLYNLTIKLKSTQSFGDLDDPLLDSFSKIDIGVEEIKNTQLTTAFKSFNACDPHQYIQAYVTNHGGHVVSSNRLFMSYPKQWTVLDPGLKVEGVVVRDLFVEFKLSARAPAFYVWLELSEGNVTSTRSAGRFSDNGFTMDTQTLTLKYIPWKASSFMAKVTVEWFESHLKTTTLYDIYTDA